MPPAAFRLLNICALLQCGREPRHTLEAPNVPLLWSACWPNASSTSLSGLLVLFLPKQNQWLGDRSLAESLLGLTTFLTPSVHRDRTELVVAVAL